MHWQVTSQRLAGARPSQSHRRMKPTHLLVLTMASCGWSTVELTEPSAPPSQPTMTATGRSVERAFRPEFEEAEPRHDAGAPPTGGGPACEGGVVRQCVSTCGSAGQQRCEGSTWEPCRPPSREVHCTDGFDDDCDGRVDAHDSDCPGPRYRCEEVEGNGCNGDPGWGDRCAPSDNTGGCSPSRFFAWCNRRNPSMPDVWTRWIRAWVDDRCDGTLSESGGQYSTWSCVSSDNERFECTTPLVLNFGERRVGFLRSHHRFAFAPGRPVHSDWPTARTPWLVRDLDGNGRIDDGRELFGSETRLANGRRARNGFEALAALDTNHSGTVDEGDEAFVELQLWRDLDGDRRVGPEELSSLAKNGVISLDTHFDVTPRCDRRGNCERERSTFTLRDGRLGAVVDVHLPVRRPALARGAARR